MSMGGQGTKRRRNIAENFNRLSTVGRTNVTEERQTTDRQTDRQTDGRYVIASEVNKALSLFCQSNGETRKLL